MTAQGFDTAGAFRSISSESDLQDVVTSVNKCLSDLADENANNTLRSDIEPKLAKYYLRITKNVQIPRGHELLIKSIAEFAQKPVPIIVLENIERLVESKPKTQEVTKNDNLAEKILVNAEKVISSIPTNEKSIRAASVILKEDGFYVSCCYCTQDIKAYSDHGINLSGLKKHIQRMHLKKVDSAIVEQTEINETMSTTSLSSTPSTSEASTSQITEEPPMKRPLIVVDEHAKKKMDVKKKVKSCFRILFECLTLSFLITNFSQII